MSQQIIYFDNNATTRVDSRVVEAMLPCLTECYGNASSAHVFGARAAALVDGARSAVARLINARESEIIFTSGGTEADNAALRGVLSARPERRHIVVSSVEHDAVYATAARLEQEGYAVTRLGVDGDGRLDLAQLERAVSERTAVVSVMLANNETGVILPVAEVSRIARRVGAAVHTDAVQAVGKIPVDVEALGVDLLAISAHKLYGPKGVGAMYIRRGTQMRPFVCGGPQERQQRGGTLNVPGIVGLGRACELAQQRGEAERSRVRALRDRLEAGVLALADGARVVGGASERLPNTSCICFAGLEADALLMLLSQRGVCASSGSACSSGSHEPSHVLGAMGVPPELAQGQIRFSLGCENTEAEVDAVLAMLPQVLARVAALSA